MRVLLLSAAMGGLLSAGSLAAQEGGVSAGDRVQIRTQSLGRVEGVVQSISGRTIVLAPTDGSPSMVFNGTAAGSELYVHTGRHSSTVKGMVIGGFSGLIGGSVVGVVAGKECTGNQYLCTNRKQVAIEAGFIMGGVGLVTGGILGALLPHNVWERSTAVWPIRGGINPRPDGVDVRISLSF